MSQDQIGYRNNIPMTKILDRLFLGGFGNAEALATANPHDITHVVNCTTETLTLPKRMRVIQLDQLDGHIWNTQKLYSAINWMRDALIGGGTVLVHCHAGWSRSPVLVACYLYTIGFDFNSALDSIKMLRPSIQPAPAILISAKKAFGIR